MNLTTVMLASCLVPVLLSGCVASRSIDSPGLSASPDSKMRRKSSSSMAVVHELKPNSKPRIFRVDTVQDLNAIYFFDDANGWVASDRELYNTTDAGQHWRRVAVTIPKGAAIESISFADQLHGWTLLKGAAPTISNYEDYRFWLMRTDDGGKTWTLQYEASNTDVTTVAFADVRNGWIGGIKYTGIAPLRFQPLIIRTEDGGFHWSDVSSRLKGSLGDKVDPDGLPANDGVMRLLPEGSVGATVITSGNALIRTTDGGSHWNQLDVIPEISEQAAIRAFGKQANQRFWILKATDSQEGTAGLLEVQQADQSWSSFTLSGAYLADAAYLTERGDFLACGYKKHYEQGGPAFNEKKEAFLVRSSDGGKNWSIAYTDPAIASVNAIFPLTSEIVWGVGTRGVIFRFDFSNNLAVAQGS